MGTIHYPSSMGLPGGINNNGLRMRTLLASRGKYARLGHVSTCHKQKWVCVYFINTAPQIIRMTPTPTPTAFDTVESKPAANPTTAHTKIPAPHPETADACIFLRWSIHTTQRHPTIPNRHDAVHANCISFFVGPVGTALLMIGVVSLGMPTCVSSVITGFVSSCGAVIVVRRRRVGNICQSHSNLETRLCGEPGFYSDVLRRTKNGCNCDQGSSDQGCICSRLMS